VGCLKIRNSLILLKLSQHLRENNLEYQNLGNLNKESVEKIILFLREILNHSLKLIDNSMDELNRRHEQCKEEGARRTCTIKIIERRGLSLITGGRVISNCANRHFS
jgi:hypothetical protein